MNENVVMIKFIANLSIKKQTHFEVSGKQQKSGLCFSVSTFT
jgi:hypothetical protein